MVQTIFQEAVVLVPSKNLFRRKEKNWEKEGHLFLQCLLSANNLLRRYVVGKLKDFVNFYVPWTGHFYKSTNMSTEKIPPWQKTRKEHYKCKQNILWGTIEINQIKNKSNVFSRGVKAGMLALLSCSLSHSLGRNKTWNAKLCYSKVIILW